jgi:predicted nucleotidyltransferase
VIRLAVFLFRKYPAVKAIYLCRGWAKGEEFPGVSDIDFLVILKCEEWSNEDQEELIRSYNKLARITILLDKNLEVYNENTFYKKYETNHYCQYRFTEGKETWQLLYGKDYVENLPSLPLEKLYGGLIAEIKVWWALFTRCFLQCSKSKQDAVTRNTICHKVISEILKMNLAMNFGILTFLRSEALKLSRQHLRIEDIGFVGKLERIAKERFINSDEHILEETKNFLIPYLDRSYEQFGTHPFLNPLRDIRLKVDSPKDEYINTKTERTHIEHVIDHVKRGWPNSYRGAYLVPSVFFNVDDLLLMIEVDPEQLPTVRQLSALYFLHRDAQIQIRHRIRLFILLPNTAFQIDSEDPRQSWQSILYPPCNPDVFELLGRPAFAIDEGGYHPITRPFWSPLIEHFLWEEKILLNDVLKNPSIYKLNSLDFLRIFWKTAQIFLMNRLLQEETILCPLTVPAIERGLREEGIPLPFHLQNLMDAYQIELTGRASTITDLIPVAIDYLREIGS